MTSHWKPWRLKSPASELFVQSFAQAHINKNITGLCEGNPPVTSELTSESASNAENIPTCWRHHDYDWEYAWLFRVWDFDLSQEGNKTNCKVQIMLLKWYREYIMCASAERSSPKRVCIPEITSDSEWFLWNTNSRGWTSFRTGAHDRFYFFHDFFPVLTS